MGSPYRTRLQLAEVLRVSHVCAVHHQPNVGQSVSDQRVQAERGAFFLDFWTASARVTNRALGVGSFCGRTVRHLAIIGKHWRILAGRGAALGRSQAMAWPLPAMPVPTCQQFALPTAAEHPWKPAPCVVSQSPDWFDPPLRGERSPARRNDGRRTVTWVRRDLLYDLITFVG